MRKILICGHFANGKESFDGQTIKTVNVYKELVKEYGQNNIIISDTYFIRKNIFKFLVNLKSNLKVVDNVIILPAQRGLKVIVPLLNLLNKKRMFKIHYIVIGGWLPRIIAQNNNLKNQLKKIDYIYVETSKTISHLEKMGFENIYQMNNFKNLSISKKKYKLNSDELRCCIFSRIEFLKGINDAIDVINEVNSISSKKIYLDLYGKIKDEYRQEFKKRIEGSKYIIYKGVIKPDESVKVIEKYDLLLFPTLYYTEGIPGTIIDSYFAGVPVLSSKWENFDDVVTENVTGISYEFKNNEDFKKKITDVLEGKYKLEKMSENCKNFAQKYLPNKCLDILFKNLSDENAYK